MTVRLEAAADEFAATPFWRRLTAAASGRGHDGHQVMLVGQAEPTDVYELRCVRCDQPVVAILVRR